MSIFYCYGIYPLILFLSKKTTVSKITYLIITQDDSKDNSLYLNTERELVKKICELANKELNFVSCISYFKNNRINNYDYISTNLIRFLRKQIFLKKINFVSEGLSTVKLIFGNKLMLRIQHYLHLNFSINHSTLILKSLKPEHKNYKKPYISIVEKEDWNKFLEKIGRHVVPKQWMSPDKSYSILMPPEIMNESELLNVVEKIIDSYLCANNEILLIKPHPDDQRNFDFLVKRFPEKVVTLDIFANFIPVEIFGSICTGKIFSNYSTALLSIELENHRFFEIKDTKVMEYYKKEFKYFLKHGPKLKSL